MSTKQVRLNGAQIDRLIKLTQRQIRQSERTLLSQGVSQTELDVMAEQLDRDHILLSQGGVIPLPDGDYQLAAVSEDGDTFTFTPVDPGRTNR